jgi:RNA polymerase sigma-70 factor (ECF subfamily)
VNLSHPARFITTRWSLVLAAGERDSQQKRRAIAELCEAYWQPVYAFIRRYDGDSDASLDLTQEFFSRLLEKDSIRDADPQRGRFRSFLLAAVRHFLSNERDRATAQKRGGGRVHFSLEVATIPLELSTAETPEREYDRQWALSLLDRSLARLEKRYAEQGKADLFATLRPSLTVEPEANRYSELAEKLGMSEGAVKVAVHRCRRRFASLLREEIAHTVNSPADVDAEVRDLFAAFSR